MQFILEPSFIIVYEIHGVFIQIQIYNVQLIYIEYTNKFNIEYILIYNEFICNHVLK